MSKNEIADIQRSLNAFTHRYLRDVGQLHVDGVKGHSTNRRIMAVKFYLGYGKRDASVKSLFVRRLRHPHSLRYSSPVMLAAAFSRRRKQRVVSKPRPTSGVATFDGVRVAAWMVPYLAWARAHGWHGRLVSGYRDPAHSEHLCYVMCGRPSCPGRCAGRASNHSGSVKPHGAVDVTDYGTFRQVIARCPYGPRIYNALPSDPVHFSSTGR